MSKREVNERKFGNWKSKSSGGLIYRYDVEGKKKNSARYIKEVDAEENTLRFYQEIYNMDGKLIGIHEKLPIDKGHKKYDYKKISRKENQFLPAA